MLTINGKADQNDVAHFSKLHGKPRVAYCAPFNEEGKPCFNTTLFEMGNGVVGFIVNVQPIYYENKDGTIRPITEILDSYKGNTIVLSYAGFTKITPRYLLWLQDYYSQKGGEVLISYGTGAFGLQPRHFTFATSFGPLYPSATGSVTCDGYAYVSLGAGNGVIWSTLRTDNGTGANSVGDNDDWMYLTKSDSGSGKWFQNQRSRFGFDTSAIGSGPTVTAATLSIFGDASAQDNLSISPAMNVFAIAPASNTAPAMGDYQTVSTTAFATAIPLSSWTTSAYNAFTLNATGYGHINKTGVTNYSVYESVYDAGNTTPTWSASAQNLIGIFYSGAGTSKAPKLTGTYTTPSSAVSFIITAQANKRASYF